MQLELMKSLSPAELREQISAMNPEWKEEVSKMNYTELISMLD